VGVRSPVSTISLCSSFGFSSPSLSRATCTTQDAWTPLPLPLSPFPLGPCTPSLSPSAPPSNSASPQSCFRALPGGLGPPSLSPLAPAALSLSPSAPPWNNSRRGARGGPGAFSPSTGQSSSPSGLSPPSSDDPCHWLCPSSGPVQILVAGSALQNGSERGAPTGVGGRGRLALPLSGVRTRVCVGQRAGRGGGGSWARGPLRDRR